MAEESLDERRFALQQMEAFTRMANDDSDMRQMASIMDMANSQALAQRQQQAFEIDAAQSAQMNPLAVLQAQQANAAGQQQFDQQALANPLALELARLQVTGQQSINQGYGLANTYQGTQNVVGANQAALSAALNPGLIDVGRAKTSDDLYRLDGAAATRALVKQIQEAQLANLLSTGTGIDLLNKSNRTGQGTSSDAVVEKASVGAEQTFSQGASDVLNVLRGRMTPPNR